MKREVISLTFLLMSDYFQGKYVYKYLYKIKKLYNYNTHNTIDFSTFFQVSIEDN